jgi:hypothetical protein
MTVTPGSTATQGVVFGFLWQTTPTIVSTDVNVLRESKLGRTGYFVPNSGRPVKLHCRVDNARMFALSQLDYIEQGSNGFGGCTGTNPSRGSYLMTWVGTTLGSNEPAAVNVSVSLTYGVRFMSPIPQTASLSSIHPKPAVHSLLPTVEQKQETKEDTEIQHPVFFLV